MEKQEKNKKLVGKIVSFAVSALLVITVTFCLIVIAQVLGKGYVSIGGRSFFKVITGSMEPNLKIGELIMTDDVSIEDVQMGDVISFRSQSADMYGMIITHRVVDIEKNSEGNTMLLTKGDNNLSVDSNCVYESNYIGKVIWSSGDGAFASLFSFATGSYGFLACVVFPSILILAIMLGNSIKSIKSDMQKLVESEQNQKNIQSQKDQESYEEMFSRIKQELIEELKGSEESVQSKTE